MKKINFERKGTLKRLASFLAMGSIAASTTQSEIVSGNKYFVDKVSKAVILRWEPSSSENVSGYKMYYGPPSNKFERVVDCKNSTIKIIEDLEPEKTYQFSCTSYNASGVESVLSNVLEYKARPQENQNYKALSINYTPYTNDPTKGDLTLTLSMPTNRFEFIMGVEYDIGEKEGYRAVREFSQRFVKGLDSSNALFSVNVKNFEDLPDKDVVIRVVPMELFKRKGRESLDLRISE